MVTIEHKQQSVKPRYGINLSIKLVFLDNINDIDLLILVDVII